MNFHNRIVRSTFAALGGQDPQGERLDTRLETISPLRACEVWDSFVSALIGHGLNVRIGKAKSLESGVLENATFIDGERPVQMFLKEASGEDGPELRLFLESSEGEVHELAASAVLEDQGDLVAWLEGLLGFSENSSARAIEGSQLLPRPDGCVEGVKQK